jgi:hypothetical protein
MKVSAFGRYQHEIKTFQQKLDSIENPKVVKEANELIKKLKSLIKDIDLGHDPTLNGYMNPHIISNKRHEIISIREKLYKLLGMKLKSKRST